MNKDVHFHYVTESRTILGDLYTPVGVYMRLRDLYPQSALMESSDYHDANNSRSFIGVNPIASVAVSHGESICTFPDGSVMRRQLDNDYRTHHVINDFLDNFKVEGENAAFCGLYGYTSFNAVRYFEDIAVKDETMEKNDAPDMYYILYRDVIVFDHHNSKVTLITLRQANASSDHVLDDLLRSMNRANINAYDFHPVGDTTSSLTDEEHEDRFRIHNF